MLPLWHFASPQQRAYPRPHWPRITAQHPAASLFPTGACPVPPAVTAVEARAARRMDQATIIALTKESATAIQPHVSTTATGTTLRFGLAPSGSTGGSTAIGCLRS